MVKIIVIKAKMVKGKKNAVTAEAHRRMWETLLH